MSTDHKPQTGTSSVVATCLINHCVWSMTQYIGPGYPPAGEIVGREAGIHVDETGHEVHIGRQS